MNILRLLLPETVLAIMALVVAGIVGYGVFVAWLHFWLIGVKPF